MSALESLAHDYHQEFWKALSDEEEKINDHLDRLFIVKGIPKENWLEFKHTIYGLCCTKFSQFDASKSSFSTWVIMHAKAVIRNYFRGSRGTRNPTGDFRAFTESDIMSPDDNEEFSMDFVQDKSLSFRDAVEDNMILAQVVEEYIKNLDQMPYSGRHIAVLSTMLVYEFDVTVQRISEETEIPPTTANEIQKEILSELKFMLLRKYGWNDR